MLKGEYRDFKSANKHKQAFHSQGIRGPEAIQQFVSILTLPEDPSAFDPCIETWWKAPEGVNFCSSLHRCTSTSISLPRPFAYLRATPSGYWNGTRPDCLKWRVSRLSSVV